MQVLNKNRIEKLCRAAGMVPEARRSAHGHEVFVADGFSLWPHYKMRHFGLGPDMFDGGCYITLWWIPQGEDKVLTGTALYCEPRHDPDYDLATRKQMRINAAVANAAEIVQGYKQHREAS